MEHEPLMATLRWLNKCHSRYFTRNPEISLEICSKFSLILLLEVSLDITLAILPEVPPKIFILLQNFSHDLSRNSCKDFCSGSSGLPLENAQKFLEKIHHGFPGAPLRIFPRIFFKDFIRIFFINLSRSLSRKFSKKSPRISLVFLLLFFQVIPFRDFTSIFSEIPLEFR